MRFERGTSVVWRSRPQGGIGYVIPLVVVEDTPDAVALVQRDGCTCMRRTGKRGGPGGRQMLPGGWDGGHVPVRWVPGHDTVRVHLPGSHHSVIRPWYSDGERFEGWYVNLELPLWRTAIGFDTCDLVLDVAFDGDDLATARLKDADELGWAEEHALVTPAEVAAARDEADRVFALVDAREGLFGADWDRWRPDPGWPVPELPPGWRTA